MTCKNKCIQRLFSSVLSECPEMSTYEAFCAGIVNGLGNIYLSMQNEEDSEDTTMALMAHMLNEGTDALIPEGVDPENYAIGPVPGSGQFH